MNFLDAIEAGLAVKNAIGTAKGVKKMVGDAKKKKDDESLANTQGRANDEALAELAGGYAAEDGEAPALDGESDADLYRVTSGEEEVPDFAMEDLVGAQAAAEMAKTMGGDAGQDEAAPSQEVVNTPTRTDSSMASADRILPVDEDSDPNDADDITQTAAPKFDKSALLDPTAGAREAGIPIETLSTLFKAAHGGKFDPNSKADRLKMNTIRDMIQEDKQLLGVSPAKFALKVYARK